MEHFCNGSKSGSVKEATKGLNDPKAIIMLVGSADLFEDAVSDLEDLYPNVPSVACVASGYSKKYQDGGIFIIAFTSGVDVASGVIKEVSTAPIKYIKNMADTIASVDPGKDNTVCIDFCTGNDAAVLNTINMLLQKCGVSLMGGTGDAGKVACNGRVYEDADAYLIVKNLTGKAIVYKENVYTPRNELSFIASDTDRSKYYVGKLNGKSAKQVYMETLGIPESAIATQTFTNPLGKMVGKDVCIISLKEVSGEGLCCYRQVNDSDVLTMLEIRDYREVAQDTIDRIKKDFKHISCVFSVNCAFRYLYFNDHDGMDAYLNEMSVLGNHCGYVGYGEHYNNQFVNQSMSCVVFE